MLYIDRCVSSTQEMALIFPDRVIAVRGSVENMSAAEAAISALLRECMEKDIHSMVWSVFCVYRSTVAAENMPDHFQTVPHMWAYAILENVKTRVPSN